MNPFETRHWRAARMYRGRLHSDTKLTRGEVVFGVCIAILILITVVNQFVRHA